MYVLLGRLVFKESLIIFQLILFAFRTRNSFPDISGILSFKTVGRGMIKSLNSG